MSSSSAPRSSLRGSIAEGPGVGAGTEGVPSLEAGAESVLTEPRCRRAIYRGTTRVRSTTVRPGGKHAHSDCVRERCRRDRLECRDESLDHDIQREIRRAGNSIEPSWIGRGQGGSHLAGGVQPPALRLLRFELVRQRLPLPRRLGLDLPPSLLCRFLHPRRLLRQESRNLGGERRPLWGSEGRIGSAGQNGRETSTSKTYFARCCKDSLTTFSTLLI